MECRGDRGRPCRILSSLGKTVCGPQVRTSTGFPRSCVVCVSVLLVQGGKGLTCGPARSCHNSKYRFMSLSRHPSLPTCSPPWIRPNRVGRLQKAHMRTYMSQPEYQPQLDVAGRSFVQIVILACTGYIVDTAQGRAHCGPAVPMGHINFITRSLNKSFWARCLV